MAGRCHSQCELLNLIVRNMSKYLLKWVKNYALPLTERSDPDGTSGGLESSDDEMSDCDEQPPGPPLSPVECAHDDTAITD